MMYLLRHAHKEYFGDKDYTVALFYWLHGRYCNPLFFNQKNVGYICCELAV